jgi:NAD(P)-dependent dehydrogenase (short-subunit alcohol dehydrogenase family)
MVGVALVTGAGRRIGRQLALAAAEAGYDLALHHRNSADVTEALAVEIRARGRAVKVVQADLSSGDLSMLVDQANELGPLSLLINNASMFEDDRIGQITAQSWDTAIATNLRAPVLLAQAFAARLAPDTDGLIVNLVDQRVWRPNPQFFSYSVSKAGLWWVTQTLAQALAPRIRVNAIGPGPTLASIHQSPNDFQTEAANVLLQRPASLADIAQALKFLIEARSVTGQMIAVDGGQHLAWQTPDIVNP